MIDTQDSSIDHQIGGYMKGKSPVHEAKPTTAKLDRLTPPADNLQAGQGNLPLGWQAPE